MSRQNDENKENIARLNAALSTLGEFFDSVAIFATWKGEGQNTFHYAVEGGNLIAVHGQVRRWLIRREQQIKSQTDIEEWAIYENEENESDSGDDKS